MEYKKEQRTFGWIQNPSSISNLKKVVSIFSKEENYRNELIKKLIFLKEHNLFTDEETFIKLTDALNRDKIPYSYLKGKGNGKARRAEAKCSGLVQAVIYGQKKGKSNTK